MTDPTLDTLTQGLNQLERKLRWLTAAALILVGIMAVGALGIARFLPGRYRIIDSGGLIHRLDTRTGEMELFVLGPESGVESVRRIKYHHRGSSSEQ